jgi:hypothetical protein
MYNAGLYSKLKIKEKKGKNKLLFHEEFKKENFTSCYDMTKSNFFERNKMKSKEKKNIYLILDDNLSEEDNTEFRETFMTKIGKEYEKLPNLKKVKIFEPKPNNDICKIISEVSNVQKKLSNQTEEIKQLLEFAKTTKGEINSNIYKSQYYKNKKILNLKSSNMINSLLTNFKKYTESGILAKTNSYNFNKKHNNSNKKSQSSYLNQNPKDLIKFK